VPGAAAGTVAAANDEGASPLAAKLGTKAETARECGQWSRGDLFGQRSEVSLQKIPICHKVSLAEGHLFAQGTGMPLHPVLLEKLNTALAPVSPPLLTRRDAQLPTAPGKVHAVIGMRRAGKTTFLR